MELNKIYYCEEEGNFYEIKRTPKTIQIDWLPHLNCDNTELDQNVVWRSLKIRKGGRHPIKQDDEEGILIYPYQSGQPFFLTPAVKEDCDKEIKNCERFGVSAEYYKSILNFLILLI